MIGAVLVYRKRGFGSAKSLYDDAIKAGLVITQEEVKEWLKSQSIKQRSNYKQYNGYSAPFARSIYSVDLMNMISLMKGTDTHNKDYRYMVLSVLITAQIVMLCQCKTKTAIRHYMP